MVSSMAQAVLYGNLSVAVAMISYHETVAT